jgi:hypothetical protein
MTNPSTSFSLDKRAFLRHKLDDILHSWARKSGHGTFFLSVTDGIPNFQFGLQFDFSDVCSKPEPRLPPAGGQEHQQQDAPQKHHQCKKARNQARAAKFRAAKAAEAAVAAAALTASTITFPGQGKVVGTAPKPVLSLPLKKGDAFPPSATATPSTTTSTTTSSTTSAATSSVVRSPPPSSTLPSLATSSSFHQVLLVKVKDAVLSDENDDESENAEYYYNCGRCNDDIESDSPSYYCPLCVKCFHVQCITGHKCIQLV